MTVADEAFSLMENSMKSCQFWNLSHEKRIFNYHLSRATIIVESAFGILASRFGIFLSLIHLATENVEGNWRPEMNENDGLTAMDLAGSNKYTYQCKDIKNNFFLYFNTTGNVAWQDKFV